MVNVIDRLPLGSRVAMIRLRSLGDCVLTTPAVALLKAHRPDLKIQMVVEPRFAQVFEGNPDICEISETASRADLVINLHGGTRSLWMTAASRAKYRAGFAHHRYSFVYTHEIPRAQLVLDQERPVHTAEHLASAMFYLGVPPAEIPRAKLTADPAERRPPYVVIHPFASAPEKAWPAECFRLLAAQQKKAGLAPVIIAGPLDDVTPFDDFEILRNAPIRDVKSLLAGASLFIGNDSGPAHIAAAFGVPVVVLFGPSNPVTWAPWRTEARVLAAPESIKSISLTDVLDAADELTAHLRSAQEPPAVALGSQTYGSGPFLPHAAAGEA